MSPALGTLLFVLLVPGTAVGVVPWLLSSGWTTGAAFFPGARLAGAVLFLLALPVFVQFNLRFVREGRGTPAPIAPTRHLVVSGPFRHVRNPGYVSVLGMVVGQGLVLGNLAVIAWALGLLVGFHAFVVLYEEPTLRRQFGAEYEEYCRRVPRWLPRWRAAALVLLLACASCQRAKQDTFPAEVVMHFLTSCEVRADKRTCRCVLDEIQERFTLDQFLALEGQVKTGKVPKEMAEAAAACR